MGFIQQQACIEQGQSNLKKEKSNGLDGQIRWKSGQDSLTFGAYFNKFSNFIGLLSTDSPGRAHTRMRC
jgi:iron complex outermembrane recepter protein